MVTIVPLPTAAPPMRILALSNFYPPAFIGGYEIGAASVLDVLRQRGHEVRVLTSVYRKTECAPTDDVARDLWLDWHWPDTLPPAAAAWHRRFEHSETGLPFVMRLLGENAWVVAKEFHNQRRLRAEIRRFRPDVIFLWNLTSTSMSLVAVAKAEGIPVVSYISDEWPTRWRFDPTVGLVAGEGPSRIRRVMRRVLRLAQVRPYPALVMPAAPDLANAQFTSAFTRKQSADAGFEVSSNDVLHWGIDLNRFGFRAEERPVRQFLYVGQVVPHKGVHTAVAAIAQLRRDNPQIAATLTIAGGSVNAEYVASLRQSITDAGLGDVVKYIGSVRREDMAALYEGHDALVFPSIWGEPFSITVVEAMAAGLPLIATTTGGTPEALSHDRNALLFAPDDAASCAAHMARLASDPSLAARLRAAARADAVNRFDIEDMVSAIEQHLAAVNGELAMNYAAGAKSV